MSGNQVTFDPSIQARVAYTQLYGGGARSGGGAFTGGGLLAEEIAGLNNFQGAVFTSKSAGQDSGVAGSKFSTYA